ncbi:unnamed protein product [Rotaria sp. Silwood2]|nr:unnamed protein product [Rotaria sp. Silwood2]CAF2573384.1 unnamed protein product [Rotaria sp. Silwood2]CAF2817219.1 unnamed protein product [Rotaria sp. Silwood2]CAF3933386.1 unnamed protein product [Rotaria sp. Silwood2]CAF4059448.1 unnamed protein product [Rotaria sp. Silwood2]
MLNRSWGVELWDQFDNVAKYAEKSLQFCEKYESFLKDRCTVEDEYAKALKKLTKTYTPKLKEQEEFYNKYTYTIAFCSTLKELQDLASQHELIAENIRERSIKQIQITVKECREQRKKCLDEYAKIKRQLDKQHELMIKSLRKYEECHDSARRAKESYEKAHEDLDLSRAQLEKARDTMTSKSKICDDAHTNYSSQVSLFNDTQRLFYERQLPSILTDLQQLDGKRSDELKDVYIKFIQSHAEVIPRIQRCLDEMTKQTEQLNANTDAQVVIEEYKSGYAIPDDEKEIDLNAGDLPSMLLNGSNNGQDQQIYNITLLNHHHTPGELARSNTLRSSGSDHSSQNGVATIYAVGNASGHVNGTQTLMTTPAMGSRKTGGNKSGGTASTIRKIFGSSSHRKPSNNGNLNVTSTNTPYSTLPPAQRVKKFQEQIMNCKSELEKNQKAKEGLTKMKQVFQENPKFGAEQDVTQQIISIDEHIEKLQAEIKRFESYIAEIERTRAPTLSEYDSTSHLRTNYGSDQSISNNNNNNNSQPGTPSQNRSPPDIPEHVTSSNDYHRLPSITSISLHQNDATNISTHTLNNDEHNGSFEDEDIDDEQLHSADHPDSQYQQKLNGGTTIIKAYALYDFNGHGINGSQYVNAASIFVGEYIDILEDDQGDGWTRIQKQDGSTGFVPSSYLRIDSQQHTTSSHQIDSGRF